AAALYLAGALWAERALLPAPASTLPQLTQLQGLDAKSQRTDQRMVVWQEARVARTLLVAPWKLVDTGQCFPFRRALTLGEHMIGEGLLGMVPFLVTGEPIFTHNLVAFVVIWIAAMAMYVLVYYWTRSASAGVVAGFLFGF